MPVEVCVKERVDGTASGDDDAGYRPHAGHLPAAGGRCGLWL